ncbi:MAG: SMP-30/gluconolactonase/LRE family protein [Pirellulales bacterium]|nr:SMP-30/gluconolactonase/LRE family protein [Pirellulales bacterium]
MDFEIVADAACQTGENPLWHPEERRLYWCDIPCGRLFRFDPAQGQYELCFEGTEPIGGFTIQEDGSLLLLMTNGAIRTWREGRLKTLLDDVPDLQGTRYNDCIADPRGRVFCGVMPTPGRPGRLLRIDPELTLTLINDDLGIPNGMGFSPDRTRFYHSDSDRQTRHIRMWNYDEQTGELDNPRIFLEARSDEGRPDGLTVDAEGYVWNARWDGGLLMRHAPDGAEQRRFEFPVRNVSSVTFGGGDYTEIYVTTAGGTDRREEGPSAGALFRVRSSFQGVREFPSRIGLAH